VTASPSEGSPADRADVILTPDQRVRVFILSTLEELVEERAAARRAIWRLRSVRLGSPPPQRPFGGVAGHAGGTDMTVARTTELWRMSATELAEAID
jgi:hypothetical protein